MNFPKPRLPEEIQKKLNSSITQNAASLPSSTPNPSLENSPALDDEAETTLSPSRGGDLNGQDAKSVARKQIPLESRYYANYDGLDWPPEIQDYHERFTRCLEAIKKRHDPVVTTIGEHYSQNRSLCSL